MKFNWIFTFALFFGLVATAQQKLTPLAAESKVNFKIRNFGFNTEGNLSGLKGELIFDKNNPGNSSFEVTVEVSTIDTDNEKRDSHLRKDDFFDVAKYPVIRIKGTPELKSDKTYQFKGDLTIKDVTKKIEFPFTITPKDGGFLFEGIFEINRLHYKIGKESATMSDEVNVTLRVLAK